MINKWITKSALAAFVVFFGGQVVSAETEMEALPVEEIEQRELVNVRTLGKEAVLFTFAQVDAEPFRTAVLSGNDTLVQFVEQSPFAIIEGDYVPLVSAKTKEGIALPQWSEGVLIAEGQVYAPATFISEQFNLPLRHNALVYEKERPPVVEVVEIKKPEKTEERVELPEPVLPEVVVETVEVNRPVVTEPKPEEPIETPEVQEAPVRPERPAPTEEKEDRPDKPAEPKPEEKPEPVDEAQVAKEEWQAFVDAALDINERIEVAFKETGIVLSVSRADEESDQVIQRVHTWLKRYAYPFTYEETEELYSFNVEKPLF